MGAGPVGENIADRAVQGGLSVAIVECELVGGECSYWACMPTKALLRPAHALAAARRVPGAREAIIGDLDVDAAFAFRDGAAAQWDDSGQVGWLEGADITLVRGHGRLAGERTVEVERDGGRVTLTARHAVAVATGSVPVVPDVPGLATASPWTNREAISTSSVPTRLAVIGGGVVASEFATMFAALGSDVTVLVRGDGLLGSLEPFAGERVAAALTEAGADVRTGTSATEVVRAAATGPATLTLTDGSTLEVDEILVATGRRPTTDDIGLDTVGLESGQTLTTDDTLRVLGPDHAPIAWLYAVGDVNGRALLTHQGKYQARAAGDVIAARATGATVDDGPWGAHVATADHAAVPSVVFTDPEVATVGLTAERARAEHRPVRVVDYDLGWIAGATVLAEDYQGQARFVVDTERHVVLGVTFVGQDVAELLQAATVAVVGEVPLHRLWHAVPAYPTLGEIWLRLLETLGRDTATAPTS
ncbi:pyridine nucleotide-disulfide oxidoreductase [Serinibacter arcticus]|uniref:Pyridine nucleotide-disulfide oxidoreductase n=1 Tax=Serinibacter arcticus TaxID=1655435 RepID=A0A2U1ZZ91_9MICO|nr:pyridine nucleotide-disulfide oxidoreductase [Serinibacter arcticus]